MLKSTSAIVPRNRVLRTRNALRYLLDFRFLTTNSAIRRGLRRSNSKEKAGATTLRGARKTETFSGDKFRVSARSPGPNHRQRKSLSDSTWADGKHASNRASKKHSDYDRAKISSTARGKGVSQLPENYDDYERLGKLKECPDHNKANIWRSQKITRHSTSNRSAPSTARFAEQSDRDDFVNQNSRKLVLNRQSAKDSLETEDRRRSSTTERLTYAPASSATHGGEQEVPLTVPYTTPASEFLYGTSVVSAALRFSGRKFYKFYSYDGPGRVDRHQDHTMRRLARSKGVDVVQVQGQWLRLLDKMSKGRPHNGYVLEASPLPRLPVTSLHSIENPQETFHVQLDYQSREEATINGTEGLVTYAAEPPRYPIILMLDGILDPGNLGALLRTACFFGIDAVAISTRNCAPLSPVALKASAGASESVSLLSISHPQSFVEQSQKNGWNFYAASAPSEPSTSRNQQRYLSASTLVCPARNHPCVLMLGAEGEGLRPNLRKKANFDVGIEGHRLRHSGLDSLNVSVAAGVLCQAFLRQAATSESAASFDHPKDTLENSLSPGVDSVESRSRQFWQPQGQSGHAEGENILF